MILALTDEAVEVTIDPCQLPESTRLRRGDIDNYAKLIMDALNGVAWADDRQIVSLHVEKL